MNNEKWNYKQITFEDMINYIEKNAPQDKDWFKSIALNDEGKYMHLKTKKEFCLRYMPDIVPKGKEKINKADFLKNW